MGLARGALDCSCLAGAMWCSRGAMAPLASKKPHNTDKISDTLHFLLPCPVFGTTLGVAALMFKVIDNALIREID